MTEISHGRLTVECVRGDIADQPDIDAVVNAANAALRPGSGVAGALHSAAGPGLYEECRALAPIAPGEAVITGGHDLPNPWVIHCLGPIYGRDHPEARLLAACYRNALRIADGRGLHSVAFPALSTGVFGYPMADAAEIAFRTVLEASEHPGSVQRVRFVLFGQNDLTVHQQALERVLASLDDRSG